jgi:mannose-1-phosphate guanylyltransferase
MDPERLVAVIMAGGGGTRFWPRSRQARPKQFLAFDGKTSLLRQTVTRLEGLIPPERILVITGHQHVSIAVEHSGLPPGSVIGEPSPRDTAACIGLGALISQRIRPDAVLVVLSADHLVHPDEPFQQALLRAAALAEANDALVAIGLRPHRPATGYGYIEIGQRIDEQEPVAHRVASFQEKPTIELARRFLLAGSFLWNSGMFAFRADTVLDALKLHVGDVFAGLSRLVDPRNPAEPPEVYAKLRRISFDYGVMEPALNKIVVEAAFEWDDLGTFEAVARHAERQSGGNLARGEAAFLDSHHCFVDNDTEGIIVVSGVDNLLVVRTQDAVLILPRQDAEKVKDVVKDLTRLGFDKYL